MVVGEDNVTDIEDCARICRENPFCLSVALELDNGTCFLGADPNPS